MDSHELPLSYRQVFEKLKSQIDTALKSGLKSQSPAFIEEFAYTYLQCLSTFSQIKAHPQWQNYLHPCQKLIVQANVLLYPEEETSFSGLLESFWVKLPAQMWENRYFHLLSFSIILVTTFIGFIIVHQNFEMAPIMMPTFLRSSHELEAYLFSKSAQKTMLTTGRNYGVGAKTLFASFLFMNNLKVAIICFISGFLFGIPTFILLIQTGLMLGALPALFYNGDLIGLGAWLLPHGVPEISAIILAGGAGLRIGFTMLHPGSDGIGKALKKAIKSVTGTIFLCTILLIWAAIVESFVRQSTLSDSERYFIAALSFIPLFLLFARSYFAYRQCNQGVP